MVILAGPRPQPVVPVQPENLDITVEDPTLAAQLQLTAGRKLTQNMIVAFHGKLEELEEICHSLGCFDEELRVARIRRDNTRTTTGSS